MPGKPVYDHFEIATFVRQGGWAKEAMEKFGCDMGTLRRALRKYGVSLPKKWSIYGRCCKNPACPYTKDGVTSMPSQARGYCKPCASKMYYDSLPPKKKAEKLARDKANRQANPERQEVYRRRWAKKNPYRHKKAQRDAQALRRADFDHAIIKGEMVTVPWSNDYDGAPKPLKVVRRYISRGIGDKCAMCDLTDGDAVYRDVPLASCALHVEKMRT